MNGFQWIASQMCTVLKHALGGTAETTGPVGGDDGSLVKVGVIGDVREVWLIGSWQVVRNVRWLRRGWFEGGVVWRGLLWRRWRGERTGGAEALEGLLEGGADGCFGA